jgi:hypothetical protein
MDVPRRHLDNPPLDHHVTDPTAAAVVNTDQHPAADRADWLLPTTARHPPDPRTDL